MPPLARRPPVRSSGLTEHGSAATVPGAGGRGGGSGTGVLPSGQDLLPALVHPGEEDRGELHLLVEPDPVHPEVLVVLEPAHPPRGPVLSATRAEKVPSTPRPVPVHVDAGLHEQVPREAERRPGQAGGDGRPAPVTSGSRSPAPHPTLGEGLSSSLGRPPEAVLVDLLAVREPLVHQVPVAGLEGLERQERLGGLDSPSQRGDLVRQVLDRGHVPSGSGAVRARAWSPGLRARDYRHRRPSVRPLVPARSLRAISAWMGTVVWLGLGARNRRPSSGPNPQVRSRPRHSSGTAAVRACRPGIPPSSVAFVLSC